MKEHSLKKLFESQKGNLEYFFEHVDLKNIEKLIEDIHQAKGMIFFTGVGKSGFIAQKISATFVSIGIKSMFLPPLNALHGDLGIVTKDDLFIFLSNSGESDELLNLIPYIRNKGALMTAVVSKKQSRLSKACHHEIFLPVLKELCPYNIVPTTSGEVQLIFGDILAVAIMQKNEITLDEFAINHPAGKIGKRLTLKVEDLMVQGQNVPTCFQDDKLMDVLAEFSKKRCGCILIIDRNHHLHSIFTDGDLRKSLYEHGPKILELPMKELKTGYPKTIQAHKMAWEAMQLMEADQKNPITVLPVVDEHKVLKGLIKMHDILQSGLS